MVFYVDLVYVRKVPCRWCVCIYIYIHTLILAKTYALVIKIITSNLLVWGT